MGDLDRPVGVIDVIDIMREGDRSVLHVARPALILSPDMQVADALREMRRRRAPMALVGDRYRGVTGLVTEKHLLERAAPASVRSARPDQNAPALPPGGLTAPPREGPAEESPGGTGPPAAAPEATGRPAFVARRVVHAGRLLGPGVIDTGMASLAGFAASAYAARMLATPDLGAYALFFMATGLLATIPRALVATPATMTAIQWPRTDRLQLMAHAMPAAGAVAVLTIPLLAAPAFLTRSSIDEATLVALLATASAAAVTTPLQLEVQAVLHMAERSWAGAATSTMRFVVTLASLLLLHGTGVETVWVPLGALAMGNVASIASGLLVASRTPTRPRPLPHWSALMARGRVLLPSALSTPVGGFVVLALVARLASAEAVGHAEAARVIAMPIAVFGHGLGTVLRPRMMEAGFQRSGRRAVQSGGAWAGLAGMAAIGYLVVVGWQHALNPMAYLVPRAYEVDGLAAFRIVGLGLGTISVVPIAALLGAQRSRDVLVTSGTRAAVRIATGAAAAPWLGAYAIPLAETVCEVTGITLGVERARRIFRGPTRERTGEPVSVSAASRAAPLE